MFTPDIMAQLRPDKETPENEMGHRVYIQNKSHSHERLLPCLLYITNYSSCRFCCYLTQSLGKHPCSVLCSNFR